MHPGDSGFVDIITDGIRRLPVHIPGNLLVAELGILRLVKNLRRVLLQKLPQSLGQSLQVRLGLVQLQGGKVHIFHALIACQQVHVPVVNLPPLPHDPGDPGLIFQGKAPVKVIVCDHQTV